MARDADPSGALPDAELVRRFKEGDRHAYARIVERYQSRVFTVCARWLGDDAVAEETAQDVFLALYRSLRDFRGDAQLSTWIYRVAINHCKNRRLYHRRRAADRHEPLEGTGRGDEPPRQLASDLPGADAGLFQSEAERLVREGLALLDDEQRSVIVMRDIEDLSYEEIADALEMPRGTVKSRLHRARAELARVITRLRGREER